MTQLTLPSARSRPISLALGALAAIGPIVFLVCEAIAALGWKAGTYDYGYNYISDLGTTVCGSTFDGRLMCSPLHGVMNFGLVAMPVAVALTVFALGVSLPLGRRVVTRILAVVIVIGMILVSHFHGGVESVADGAIVLHVAGASVAILCANVLAIVFGASRARLGWPRWYGVWSVVFGVVGLAGLVALLFTSTWVHSAVLERVAVYAIFAWLFTTTVALVRSARRGAVAPAPVTMGS